MSLLLLFSSPQTTIGKFSVNTAITNVLGGTVTVGAAITTTVAVSKATSDIITVVLE